MQTERQLIRKCLKNSAKAKHQLYKEHEEMMFGVCLRYAKNRMQAEDMLHDGFIRVLNNLGQFRFDGPLGAWIRRVIVNNCLNHLRSDKSNLEDDIENIHYGKFDIDTSSDVQSELSAKELLSMVQSLPNGYRTVFNLYAIEGYKHKEIAEQLGISENTSKTQLAKARKALQDMVKELYAEEKKIRVS